MRTIIELPGEQLEALDALCRRERISRAEAIRRAVAILTSRQSSDDREQAFGLWRERATDGLTYQRRIRREWTASTRRPRR